MEYNQELLSCIIKTKGASMEQLKQTYLFPKTCKEAPKSREEMLHDLRQLENLGLILFDGQKYKPVSSGKRVRSRIQK